MSHVLTFYALVLIWTALYILLELKLPQKRWVRALWFCALPFLITVGVLLTSTLEEPDWEYRTPSRERGF